MQADTFVDTRKISAGPWPWQRMGGIALIAAGLMWQPLLAFEKLADLEFGPPRAGSGIWTSRVSLLPWRCCW